MPIMEELTNIINKFCLQDAGNRLPDGRIIFDQPLIGVASASDQLFKQYLNENIIGPHFNLPETWLSGARSVLSYYLPFRQEIRESNYGRPPASEEWLHGRFLGERFNEKLRRLLTDYFIFIMEGSRAIAPLLDAKFLADYELMSSNWSERHIAYAAGLGTFGLHRGLITEKGVAGRFGSVITDFELPVSSRTAKSYFDNCPFLVDGSCGHCIKRCPAGAISRRGKNKQRCYQYMFTEDHLKDTRKQFAYPHSICGKCQVDVPCEAGIPQIRNAKADESTGLEGSA